MTPDDVTVADSNGNVLHAPGHGPARAARASSSRPSFDTALSTAVSTYLATALGPNHADVHVQSDLNFDQQKTTSVTNTHAGRHRRQAAPAPAERRPTENVQRRRRGGDQRRARRDAGRSRRGAGSGAADATRRRRTRRTTRSTRSQTDIQQAPGKIKRLSVSVLLDSSVVKPADVAELDQADPGRGRLSTRARRRQRRCRSRPVAFTRPRRRRPSSS